MPMLKDDYQKTEKINGVIYNMSPAASFRHGIVNGKHLWKSEERELARRMVYVW
ncbi:MAG: hypothetical protein ACLSGB_13750 [Dorea sp.]